MGRGIFSGVIWGSVVAIGGLWIASQLGEMVHVLSKPPANISAEAPDPVQETEDVAEAAPDAPAEQAGPATDPSRQTAELDSTEVDAAPAAKVGSEEPLEAAEPMAPVATPDATQAPVLEQINDTTPAADGGSEAPQQATMDSVPETVPAGLEPAVEVPAEITENVPDMPVPELAGTLTAPDVAPISTEAPRPNPPAAESTPTVDFSNPQVVETPILQDPALAVVQEPVPETLAPATPDQTPTQSEGSDLARAALPDSSPKTPKPDAGPPAQEQAALEPIEKKMPVVRRPSTGTGENGLTTRTSRLPTIGGDQQDSPDADVDQGETAEEAQTDGPAIARFAVPFANPDRRPMMAILLLVDPNDPVAPGEPLPFPVSYVVDASSDSASQAATRFRNAGSEVVAMAPIADQARPTDVEVSFQTYMRNVPNAVAIMDTRNAAFQSSRATASQVADALAASGHGMITFSRGLNSATQVAERAGVPAALVFREFDNDGQNKAAIKRFLDQAAFRAGQQTGVILVGHNRPETIAALLEWSLGNRATTVALAPVSAVLLDQ